MERATNAATTAQVVLAILGVMAALHLMKVILVPVALALLLACLLAPATNVLRRLLPLSATGAAIVLFLLLSLVGLYLASLTAQSLVQAARTLPAEAEGISGQLSRHLSAMVQDQPYLRGILPEPGTIDLLGDRNRALLFSFLSDRLADVSYWVGQGLVVLVLVLFLLAESEMLVPKLVRFFAPAPGDAKAAERALQDVTSRIRAFLVTRTLINLGLGLVVTGVLWLLGVRYAVGLGIFVAVASYIPYVGQVLGGVLLVLITIGQSGSLGDALLATAAYLAMVGLEGYVVTPYVMGRSLDLNGTTVLLACLFWGFLWGLVGLILAIPITATLKLVFQHIPALQRWSDMMSRGAPPRPVEPAASTTARVEPPGPPARTTAAPAAEDLHPRAPATAPARNPS